MFNTIHESAANVKDSQDVSSPAVSYTTFKYHHKEEIDAQYTY